MLAFHNDPAIKEKYLARVRTHIEADELIHGVYWEKGKGCAVGCTVHSSNHAAYEVELGIPSILAKIEDGIFESLTNGRAKPWPEQFLMAPQVGADLSGVWPQFAVWLLVDPKYGVIQFSKSQAGRKAIRDVADAYQQVLDGTATNVNWSKFRNAAADADAYAAADAKRQEWRNAQADKLLELMSAAK
jgi:hypothetical protein